MRIALSLLLLSAVVPVSVFAQEAHPGVTAALTFIEHVMKGENEAAYQGASQKFRSVNSMEQFENFVSKMEAGNLKTFEVTKATASQDGSSVTVIGKGKNKEGKGRQAIVGVAKEGENYGMAYFRVRTFGTSAPPPVNDTEAAMKLANGALQRVAGCLESGDFAPYLDEISTIHRQTFGDDMLVSIVKQLDATRYGPVSGLADRLKPGQPASMSGELARYHFVVDYPDLKRRLLLEFVSLWSEPNPDPWPSRWQLQFLEPDPTTEKPSPEETTALARETLTGLLNGLAQNNLEPFYRNGSPFFQEVVPLQNFQASFPAFTGNQIDFSEWKPEEAEVLNTELSGTVGRPLSVEVLIPTPTEPAYATLTFLKETGAWEFSGIFFHSKSPEQRANQPVQ